MSPLRTVGSNLYRRQRCLKLRVRLVRCVDEQIRLFDDLVSRVGVEARVGTILMTKEKVAGELVRVIRVPEELGIDEAGAELVDDDLSIPRHVEPLKLHQRMCRTQ